MSDTATRTTARKVAAIIGDIQTTAPHLADLVLSPILAPIIEQIIADILAQLAICAPTPVAAAALFADNHPLRARLHAAALRVIVRNDLRAKIKDRTLRAQLVDPITASIIRQGPSTTAEDVVAMTAEAQAHA